jgi:membrane-associated protease RseP (regulator of RpoE activity)
MSWQPDEPPNARPSGEFDAIAAGPPIQAEVVPEKHSGLWDRARTPVLLFVATCFTTIWAGLTPLDSSSSHPILESLAHGTAYAAPLLFTLLCHEFGHYLQARRYHVSASLPYFIPMPFGPLGTMGAVIAMRSNMGDRKALFDIGISGPLAGLVPALICSVVGLEWSTVAEIPQGAVHSLGEPLLFKFLAMWIFGPLPPGTDIYLHPLAYAGWVGILITALNLFPIGQLDGGHVLYALLRRRAQLVASVVLGASVAATILTQNYQYAPMLLLLFLIGPTHPPTSNDDMPLGTGRIVLGWLTLLFVIVGFTPTPFS